MRKIWQMTSASVNVVLFVGLTVVCGSAMISTVSGASIGVFNTGEGNFGTALPAGQIDPHYSLISAPFGVPLTAITTVPNPFWTPNTAMADWISPTGAGNLSSPVGEYVYQTTFNLAGFDPSTAKLSGSWTSDNNACIDLNG